MMNRFLIYFFAFTNVATITRAQTSQNNETLDSFESLWQSNGNSVLVFNNAYDGIHGSPYLQNTWFLGEVTMLSGNKYENLKLKYDIMEDNVLVKDKSGKEIFPSYGSVRSFNYQDSEGNKHVFINLSVTEKGVFSEKNGFFELLYNGGSNLYIKRSKYLKRISSKGAYSSNKSYDEFRDNPPVYYLIDKEGMVKHFIRGKKSVLSALNSKSNLSDYAKKKKLNLKKDEDVISLVKYYDSLN